VNGWLRKVAASVGLFAALWAGGAWFLRYEAELAKRDWVRMEIRTTQAPLLTELQRLQEWRLWEATRDRRRQVLDLQARPRPWPVRDQERLVELEDELRLLTAELERIRGVRRPPPIGLP
jgi:hypothetical protein